MLDIEDEKMTSSTNIQVDEMTNLGLSTTEFRQSEHNLFRLQVLKPLVVDLAYPLMPQVDIRLDLLSFREHGGAYVIGVEDEHPPIFVPVRKCLAFFSRMKHPRCVNRTSIPWSTICPTNTRFFVVVGTCNTFMSFPFCPTWLKGTSPKFSIGCGVSSPVATTPGCIGFSRYENHSLWHAIWFDAPESMYHNSLSCYHAHACRIRRDRGGHGLGSRWGRRVSARWRRLTRRRRCL